MKKVLFVVSTLDRGGVENYLLRFLDHSVSEIDALVFCKIGRKGPFSETYEERNHKVVTFKMGYFNPISWYKLYTLLKTEKIDSLCDFTGNFAGLCLMTAYFAGIKKRIVFYRQSSNHFNQNTFRLLYNAFVKKMTNIFATDILFNSQQGMDYFFNKRSKNDNRFELIANGIDTSFLSDVSKQNIREELLIPQDAFVIGHTGRYNSAKNHNTIIKIAEKTIAQSDRIFFVLCGNETEKLWEIIPPAISKNIKILGYRQDVNRILNSFDVFLFPSITEGQPNSLIEAMIVGLPVLASDIPSIKEVVPQDKIQMLTDPMNFGEFSEKIMQLYTNQEDGKKYIYQDFALNQFDAVTQFGRFKEKL